MLNHIKAAAGFWNVRERVHLWIWLARLWRGYKRKCGVLLLEYELVSYACIISDSTNPALSVWSQIHENVGKQINEIDKVEKWRSYFRSAVKVEHNKEAYRKTVCTSITCCINKTNENCSIINSMCSLYNLFMCHWFRLVRKLIVL